MTLFREVENTKFGVFRGETHKQRRLSSVSETDVRELMNSFFSLHQYLSYKAF